MRNRIFLLKVKIVAIIIFVIFSAICSAEIILSQHRYAVIVGSAIFVLFVIFGFLIDQTYKKIKFYFPGKMVKEDVCILARDYHKIVVASANVFVRHAYQIEYAELGWYVKSLFGKKQRGHIFMGFSIKPGIENTKLIDWGYKDSEISPLGFDPIFTFSSGRPIFNVFIPESIYGQMIQNEQNFGFVLNVSKCVVAINETNKYRDSDFCYIATKFVKNLKESEIKEIKSIDTFVSGI